MEIPLKTTLLDLDLLIVYAAIMFYVCKTTVSQCDGGYKGIKETGTCIKLVPTDRSWTGARKHCQGEGGDLVKLLDLSANTAVYEEFIRDSDLGRVWIGLHRTKDKFEWLNEARKVEFIHWADGEPNTGLSSVCVSWNYFENSEWTDDPCNNELYFLCEKTPIDCAFVPQGFVCKQECTDKCRKKPGYVVCDDRTGNCFVGCDDFYSGLKCDSLCQGSYGRDCSSPCNPNCGGPLSACDPYVGNCTFGCDDGFQGVFCESPCPNGTYGLGCAEHCSSNCKGPNTVCDNIDGHCPDGCQPGYTGEDCLSVCNGTYGQGCAFPCNPNCGGELNACDPVKGNCAFGCDTGFQGVLCESQCSNGTYGLNCAERCSRFCGGPDHYCKNDDGKCLAGCESGYTGAQCLTEKPEEGMGAVVIFGILFLLLAALTTVLLLGRNKKQGADAVEEEAKPKPIPKEPTKSSAASKERGSNASGGGRSSGVKETSQGSTSRRSGDSGGGQDEEGNED